MTFIIPCWLENDFLNSDPPSPAMMLFVQSCLETQRNYIRLIKEFNWHPQQAREVLPNSLKTEIVVKANIREWRHIFRLRCSKPAHPQMRALMEPLRKELNDIFPYFFKDVV
jgi:thymidylate synthase (FAD)